MTLGGPLLERGIIVESVSPNRSRLSILQWMKSVVFCAVAFACVAPMLHLWRIGAVNGGTAQGLVFVALFEAIVVPLVWVGLSWCLIRRGAWRDGLIAALLLCSVSVALCIACWFLIGYTIPAYGNLYDPPDTRVGARFLAIHVSAILALAAASSFLALRLRRANGPGPSSILSETKGGRTAAKSDSGEV
jgi:hypothetical protein